MKCLASCAFLILLSYSQAAADFSGPVVSILDGDTIEVLNGHHAERIRLSGIDCPEKGQSFGQKAKHAASALIFGKTVTLQTHGHDRYQRTLADVILLDGTNVNHALVKEGWCWWYRKYAPGNATLEQSEAEAREAQQGLWADPHPVPPWEGGSENKGASVTDLSGKLPSPLVCGCTRRRSWGSSEDLEHLVAYQVEAHSSSA